MFEIYKLPQGKIVISYSDKHLSIGLLQLKPHHELTKHNRPVTEQLVQVEGTCIMKLFEGDTLVQEVTLHENEALTIPAHQYHMHTNPTNNISVTLWKFEGDIAEVLTIIRNTNPKIL